MEMAVGMHLGPYELLSPLGAGGMGEVYRARDSRLDRDVAIKVVTGSRLTDPAARARFEREMAITARLTHPRICALFDVGIDADRPYFVMELLHGETLATRLDRAQGRGLALDEALGIAGGIAEALAFAHRHGVVHGDVKPANVMLTSDGVKLLDFGIAESRAGDSGLGPGTATRPVPIGTPAYMAPEQIDGQQDSRADLFALGAVMYEMLAGQRAFPGETSSDTLGALLQCAPRPLDELRPDLPRSVVRLVHRCLRKIPDERWHSAADLGDALRWIREPPDHQVGTQVPRRRAGFHWLTGVAAVGALAVGVAGWTGAWESASSPRAEFHVEDVLLPDGERFVSGQGAWTRDGRRVALVTQSTVGASIDLKLWTREIGVDMNWRLIDGAGPEAISYPSWSPDGRMLAYFRDHKLVRVSYPSSAPVVLTDARDGRGTTWLDEDTILFAPENEGDIWKVAASGGTPSVLVKRQAGDFGVKFPTALGRREFLFWAQRSSQAASEIRVASFDMPAPARTIVQSAKAGAYADGHLFFVQDNRLVAQPIDSTTWVLHGHAEPMPVEMGLGGNIGAPLLTTGGAVAGVQSLRRETRELTWVDRAGQAVGAFGEVDAYRTMALSPDGRQLLVERAAPGVDVASIWLMDLESGASRRLATEVGAQLPAWHPEQSRVAFRASVGPGGSGAVQEHTFGDRVTRSIVEVPASARPAGWLPSGELVWWAGDALGKFNGIFVRSGAGTDRLYRRQPIGADILRLDLRPDGTGLAYTSNDSGVFEVYVDTLPTPRSVPWRVTTSGGSLPKWSHDGRELFFESRGSLYAVATTAQGGPAGVPRRLFAFEGADYDVHPDGRILVQRRRRPEQYYLRVFRHWSMRPVG